ncbi:MAG: hypothetical protein KF753_03350 [Caldilineaceae bacterium]|nr:hypothetical protein [Caldilineaceae bacterium]
MKRTIFALAVLLLMAALALSPKNPAIFAAQSDQNSAATPTPAPEPEAKPAAVAESAAEPTMAELLARLESLETTVAQLSAAAQVVSYAQADAVNTAVYLLDTAGLHGVDVRLNEEDTILPGDSGQIARVARLLTTVDWPASLAADAADLHATLAALAVALGDDDLDEAAPLATQAHEDAHHFSHHAQEWLAEAVTLAAADATGQANAVNTAIYLLDGAGLHGVDVRLNEEGTILPGDSGQIARAARVLTTVDWPDSLAEDAAALHTTLAALAVALGDDDLDAAAPLATQAHEEAHDFSHHAQEWLDGLNRAPNQANRVNTALYLLDAVDLHGLAERLTDGGAILPGDSGEVAPLARLLTTVQWPDELAEDASALHDTLSALALALADDDVAAATPLAGQAHDDAHEFSEMAQEWLSVTEEGGE